MRPPLLRPLALAPLLAAFAACSDPTTAPHAAVAGGPRHDLGVSAGGTYYVHNACSGKLLDVENVSKDDGARVHLWASVAGPNQQWTLAAVGDGSYTLTSVNSGKALDVFGWNTANGAAVGQWAANGGANQHWTVTDVGGGYAKLTPAYAPAKALDVQGADTANGTPIQLFDTNSTCAQRWHFEPVTSTAPRLSLLGVNLAGPAFAPQNLPGVLGQDFVYPNHGEIDYYASKGMNVFRLSFLIERLEPSQGGPLDGAELARIDDVVNYSASKGIKTILDPHNFGSAWGNDIGTSGTPTSSFAGFWSKVAAHFATNPNVIFGLMNEPHNQSAAQWAPEAQAGIDAIRGAGATSQEILVPGTGWDNAKDWNASSDNATIVAAQVHDPNHNMVFEAHVYFDAGSGGTEPAAVSSTIGVERITDITRWAEATGNKLFLGEFGASNQPTSLAALNNMLAYMQQHAGVWQGGTYWAAGPGWGDYFYSIEPSDGVDKPQMGVLGAYAPRQ